MSLVLDGTCLQTHWERLQSLSALPTSTPSHHVGLRPPTGKPALRKLNAVFVGCVESSRRTGPAVVVRLEDSTHPTELVLDGTCLQTHWERLHETFTRLQTH